MVAFKNIITNNLEIVGIIYSMTGELQKIKL